MRWDRFVFIIAALLLVPAFAVAQESPAAPQSDAQDAPENAVWAAAEKAMQRGPQTIALRDQATLKLPAGYGFVPTRQASAMMEAMGNGTDPNFIGLILPIGGDQKDEEEWMISVDYDPAGYINDEDAKKWDADELLSNLKEGTEAGNELRAQHGVAPLEVTRWIEPPAYDSVTQRLVWAAEARDKGAPKSADNTVNYNTYVLGREGYVSLNLITSSSLVETQKPIAKTLLSQVAFIDGKRYADFDSSTDKIAAYGLAALVGGVAVKKLGLLALAAAFLAKSFKLVILAVAGIGVAIKKFFTRKA
jgi:uncharacterized membrane-anchored protein